MLLTVPKTKTKLYGDGSSPAWAPRLWNALPVDIKNSESLNIFKSKVRRLLFRSCYRVERSYYCRVSRLLLSLLLLLFCVEYKQYKHYSTVYFFLFFFRNLF